MKRVRREGPTLSGSPATARVDDKVVCVMCKSENSQQEKDGGRVCTECGVVQPGRLVDDSPEHDPSHFDEFADFVAAQTSSAPDPEPSVFKLLGTPTTITDTGGAGVRSAVMVTAHRFDRVGTGAASFTKGEQLLTRLCRAHFGFSESMLLEARSVWLAYCHLKLERRNAADENLGSGPEPVPGSRRNYRVEEAEVPAVILHVVQLHGLPFVVEDVVLATSRDQAAVGRISGLIDNKLLVMRQELRLAHPSAYAVLKGQASRALLQELHESGVSEKQRGAFHWAARFLVHCCVVSRMQADQAAAAADPMLPNALARQRRWAVAALAFHVYDCLCVGRKATTHADTIRMGNSRASKLNTMRRLDKLASPAASTPTGSVVAPQPLASPPSAFKWRTFAASPGVPGRSKAPLSVSFMQTPAPELERFDLLPLLNMPQPKHCGTPAGAQLVALVPDDAHGEKRWRDAQESWRLSLPAHLCAGEQLHNNLRVSFVQHLLVSDDYVRWRRSHALLHLEQRLLWAIVKEYVGTDLQRDLSGALQFE